MRKFTAKQVDEAYDALGVQHGVMLDEVKVAYKKLALRLHPDKNPGASDEPFKRVNNAFEVLKVHLDPDHQETLDDMFDESEFDFFAFLFERMMFSRCRLGCGCPRGVPPKYSTRGPPGGYAFDDGYDDMDDHIPNGRPRMFFSRADKKEFEKEIDEARVARAKETLVEQKEAELRRKQAAEAARVKAEKARAREQEDAAKRCAEKHARKRAATSEKADQAGKDAKARLLKKQTNRSAVFALLRGDVNKRLSQNGRRAAIQKAIWDQEIAVSGWEVLKDSDMESLKGNKFSEETMLHLAVKANDGALVAWLCDKGAAPEEKDKAGYTAIYRAVEHAHREILAYFLDTYPITDNIEMYETPAGTSLLLLAVQSGKASLVSLLVAHAYVSDVGAGWSASVRKQSLGIAGEWEAIKAILSKKPGFSPGKVATSQGVVPPLTPPPTPHPLSRADHIVQDKVSFESTMSSATPPPSQKRKQKKRRSTPASNGNRMSTMQDID